jgi:hypothetical protein
MLPYELIYNILGLDIVCCSVSPTTSQIHLSLDYLRHGHLVSATLYFKNLLRTNLPNSLL